MSQLKIFVSSTCYDLTQIRTDLQEYINNSGHTPLLSDFESFPIDPDKDTLENCLTNVATSDIFVLIIGNRYGNVIDKGTSITNSEYLYAKSLGIPIYIFISKNVITYLPFWKKNMSADFSDQVDTVKVFEFVEELREKNKHWCYTFEKVQDIIPTLKTQLSNQFKRSLDLIKKYKIKEIPRFFENLSAEAITIALNKEELYEGRFFSQTLKDEIDKYESLKLDLEFRIIYSNNNKEINSRSEFIEFSSDNPLPTHLLTSITNLFQQAYPLFYGIPGQPSDLKGLYYVAHSIAKIFMEMIMWCIKIRSTEVGEEYMELRDDYAEIFSTPINQIWEYCQNNLNFIDNRIEESKISGEKVIANTLNLDLNNDAMDRFKGGLGL